MIKITEKIKKEYGHHFGYFFTSSHPANVPGEMPGKGSNISYAAEQARIEVLDKNNIDLQKSIKNYLPDFPQKWADSITIHQLLNHTSGIISFEKSLATKPGLTFKYTDLNLLIASQR